MRRFLFGSTSRQVAWVVGLATLSSNLLVLGFGLLIAPGSLLPGSVRAFAAEVVTVFEMLDRATPAQQPAIIASIGPEMLGIAPATDLSAPGRFDAFVTRALQERLAEREITATARAYSPSGNARKGLLVMLGRDGMAWSFALPEARARLVVPSLMLPPTTIILLLGVPLLLVLLWMASRVTRPLEQLARLAGSLGTAGHATVLPEVGTSEIRGLTRAINGLLVRLREDVAERARILAGVSHDLRTPMTRLRLRLETVHGEEVRARLSADLAQMERIVGASLTLLETDLREEEAEPLDLAALASTIRDQFADAGQQVTYEGPLHLVLRGQPAALERALTNLVDNACKHAGHAVIRLEESRDAVSLTVLDEGPGIAEEELPHITEAFRRQSRAADGFGLGLAIVASVARAHGGQLRLRNRFPHGLAAELRLCRHARDLSRIPAEARLLAAGA